MKQDKPEANSWIAYVQTIKESLEIDSLTKKQSELALQAYIRGVKLEEFLSKNTL